MAEKIPHNALVVVADGTGARFFRNTSHASFTPPIFSMTALQASAPPSHHPRRRMRLRSPNN